MPNHNKGDERKMSRTGIFVTESERDAVEIAYKCSGMFLSGGKPMGDPAWEVEQLRKKYEMPEGYGLDLKTGEFVSP